MNNDNKHTPLRILHAITFYDEYLSRFYAGRSSLTRAPYAAHIKAFVHDAHAAIHLLPPYLNNCQAQFVVPNCAQSQQAWARENGIPFDTWNAATQEALLLAQLDAIRPDIIYFNNTILFQADFIKKIPYTPRLIVGWRAADVPWNVDWTGYDIILSGLPRLLAFASTVGAKEGTFFVPGMPHWIAREVENIPQDIDVVFAGGIYPTQHVKRLALLDLLAQAATQHGFSLALYLSCHPSLISTAMRPYVHTPVFGMDMHRALRRGRIVLDVQGTIGLRRPDGSYALDLAQGDTSNMRLFEATGGGSLLLTENLPGLSKLFDPQKEVATYETSTEMIDKIQYYLAHEAERQTVAAAGKARCLGEWNMQNRAKAFMSIVQKHLQATSQNVESDNILAGATPLLPASTSEALSCAHVEPSPSIPSSENQVFPSTFAIETVLGCNLRCVECAVGANLVRRPYGHMKLEQFKIIADRIRPYCRYAFLHIWGEPMINPDIIPIIKYASVFSKTNISTNANMLDDHLAKELIYSGVTDIIVSIDGMTQEIYSQYRRRGQLSNAQRGLLNLTKHRLRSGLSVDISPQFIVFEHNKHEMAAFEHFCQELGLKAAFKAPYLRPGSALKNSGLPQFERHIDSSPALRRQSMRGCAQHNSCTILLDGSVVACCYDHNGQTTFGNIYTQSLEEIWNTSTYKAFRTRVQEGAAPNYCMTQCLAY